MATSSDAVAIPWIEKYRPSNLNDIHGHHEILSTFKRFLENGSLPNLLLHGPAGTGKTTCAVAICREIYGDKHWKLSTMELNASDDRGISVIRNQIKQFSQTTSFGFGMPSENEDPNDIKAQNRKKIKNKFKVVILDECDNMTQIAQFALRRMMEQYSSVVRFVIICNFAHKIIPALQSRCTAFRFSTLPPADVILCIQKVAKTENIIINESAMTALQRVSNGDLRKVLNLLQSLALWEHGKSRAAKRRKVSKNLENSGDVEMADGDSTNNDSNNSNSKQVTISEAAIYETVGLCTPSEMDSLLNLLMTCESSKDMNNNPGHKQCINALLSQRANFSSMIAELHSK